MCVTMTMCVRAEMGRAATWTKGGAMYGSPDTAVGAAKGHTDRVAA